MTAPQRLALIARMSATVLFLLAAAGVPVRAQPLAIGANVDIGSLGGAQSEVGIAVNPANRLNLVAVANDIGDLSRLAVWFSTDGGATWTANFINEVEDDHISR